MGRVWMVVCSVALIGCGGKAEVTGPPEGTCSPSQNQWSCTTFDAGAPDADVPRVLPQCASNVGSGSCSQNDTTTDTTNATQPAHFTSECFQCTSDGLGVDWNCVSQSWQVQGVYSCP